ncbi:MAG: hypothetical protein M3235_20460 [Actinomycetota bacterium]|nr:hypothetical protein [Actinomycetota bacterium]
MASSVLLTAAAGIGVHPDTGTRRPENDHSGTFPVPAPETIMDSRPFADAAEEPG